MSAHAHNDMAADMASAKEEELPSATPDVEANEGVTSGGNAAAAAVSYPREVVYCGGKFGIFFQDVF